MKHLGDITKINGYDAPPVNVIIGGSPCQDLSVAGKRAGLAGERSGLFMEQIRIIKEMREESERSGATDIKPRFMVWENVPGALSSNKGQDFRAVLEETARIVEKNLPDLPIPPEGWHYSGLLMGEGWSVAWRIFDAQFWGVPQRRRRIALVADFGGHAAPEILFERKGVFGDSPPSGTPWKDFTAAVKERFGKADRAERVDGFDVVPLNTSTGHVHAVAYSFDSLSSNSMKSNNPKSGCRKVDIAKTIDTTVPDPSKNQGGICILSGQGRINTTYCLQGNGIDRADTAGCNGRGWREDKSYTLNTIDGPAVYDARGNGDGETAPTITGDHQNRVTDYTGLACGFPLGFRPENTKTYEETATTVCNGTRAGFCNGVICNTVRRLTPLECERLQGFPDGWTDIGTEYIGTDGKKRKVSDSARYKALGNSIALPPWAWLLERLSFYCGDDCTMASLFDGIGGFPLIWEMLNGQGTCLWASEIEEFPIAVTKYHFCEEAI